MEFQPLKYIYKASGVPGAYTLLLLHGTGGDENDLIPLAQNFGDKLNILSVRGNVSENGMPRFFKRLGMGVFDEKDLDFRTDELVAFIKAAAVQEGFDSTKVIALGYSNGANIAGAALVKYPDFLAGAILYRPMQPFTAIGETEKAQMCKPVFFSSGKADPTIQPHATPVYVQLLKDRGYKVDFHNLPTGHNLIKDDLELSVAWLAENFK
ncbi:alpha/beta hydrolase [Flavobacterium sp. DG1-102-2]|uniref:alpha/beta hydrolase n=1 Tax=Flavobacterium sp. DG1-102-2 TaxID=3081663 RepID=UPI00294A5465|nr:alpha/beta hydrolase [Flavobacterium sp. DG1-102-2]MDV6169721.1 alpha/beta hydrolase [Flavobacterium sp. DG1-102-2]